MYKVSNQELKSVYVFKVDIKHDKKQVASRDKNWSRLDSNPDLSKTLIIIYIQGQEKK